MKNKYALLAMSALSCAVVFGDVPGLTSSANGYTWTFTLMDGLTAAITDCYPRPRGELVIPSSLMPNEEVWQDGNKVVNIPVSSVEQYSLADCLELESVEFPDSSSFLCIGPNALYGCSNLVSVTMHHGLSSIGTKAFAGCRSLPEIIVPDSVESIGEAAFTGCGGITNAVLPFVGGGSGTSSENARFFGYIFGDKEYEGGLNCDQYYTGLYSAYVPEALENVTIARGNILSGGMSNLKQLKTVNLLAGVTLVSAGSFSGCSGMTDFFACTGTEIRYSYYPDYYSNKSIPFDGCTSVKRVRMPVNQKHGVGELFPNAYQGIEEFEIPEGETRIGDLPLDDYWSGCGAFAGCTNLVSIKIPSSVTIIGDDAFLGCSRLSEIHMPTNVTDIGDSAFYNCSGLTSVDIPDSVANIWANAFYGCTGLIGLTIGNSVASIGNKAFYNCSNLTSVKIPDSVTSIGQDAFYGCNGLTDLTIGNSVASIGNKAFYNCSNLTSVKIPDSVTSIGQDAFYGCSGLTDLVIGNGVVSIGRQAFYGCSSLTDLTIGGSVTRIGAGAFYNCGGLTSVKIPDSVMSIGNSAFSGCIGLTDVTIGSGVTSIGGAMFSGCIGLTSVTIPNSVTNIGDAVFADCSGLTSLMIPDSVQSIGVQAFAGCGGLTDLTIGDGVVSIGNKAFELCDGLANVTIPNSVTNIGNYAFYGCSGLTDLIIGDGVASMGGNAFNHCSSLTSVTIPQFICSMKLKTVFPSSYMKITHIVISDSVTSIGAYAFYGCSGLPSLTIPDSVTSIGDQAFSGCSGLTDLTIGSGVTSIGEGAFYGCNGLADEDGFLVVKNILFAYVGLGDSVVIPNSVTNISYSVFYDCSKLSSVTIPNLVTSLGAGAFYGCSKLVDVTFEGDAPSVGSSAFYNVASGCEAFVSPKSEGWGVAVGEKWNGLTLRYWPEVLTEAGSDADAQAVVETFSDAKMAENITTLSEYEALGAWASEKNIYQPALQASHHAYASFALGADKLFDSEPEIEIGDVDVGEEGDGEEKGAAITLSVTVKDGEDVVKVAEGRVAEMFEATSSLGDWDGESKLEPKVEVLGSDGKTMRFKVTPGDGKATCAFLRIRK